MAWSSLNAAPCKGALEMTYQVYAWDLSVRATHLDQTHGFFNGTSVFLKAHGKEELPHIVDIQAPDGEMFATAGKDTKVRIYEESTKTLLMEMKGGYGLG